ncbi:MAG: sugar phosphate isomerase/epimerase [Chloroflexota bacterium]
MPNKLAPISSFLGLARNRYMQYQPERTLADKFALAAQIQGIDGLELCYPADFEDPASLRALLARYGLGVAAVNFRSRRTGQWWRGSFTSADPAERLAVVDDLRRCMDATAALGVHRVTTCPLNEGHDYPFEVDYLQMYAAAEETFAAACAHNRAVRLCIEYKWNDPRARCLFATAGETLSFCQTLNADNLGATLDLGHALLGRERPGQSVALLARAGRLFYVHVNDNDRDWDWDMIPGAYHLWESVEFFHYLFQVGYADDWYGFDVFPKETDTVEVFSASFAITRQLEALAGRVDAARLAELTALRNPARTMAYIYSLIH